MARWLSLWWSELLGRFRRPATAVEAVQIAVRTLQSLREYPVLLSADDLATHRDRPVYLLTRAELVSADEQDRALGSRRDLWVINFRFVDPADRDVVYSHPEGPFFSVDARTRQVELQYQM